MKQSKQARTGMVRRWRLVVAATFGATALVGALALTSTSSEASSPHSTATSAAAQSACSTYEQAEQATVSGDPSANPATIVDSYPTTASNLELWLKSFMPMVDPAAIRQLSPSANVSACILQGNWVLPSGGPNGTLDDSYEVVMIGPDGTATPVLFGPAAIVNAAAPAVGAT
jgi:hypothetical protein